MKKILLFTVLFALLCGAAAFAEQEPVMAVVDDVLFDMTNGILVSYPSTKKETSYAVPLWVKTIGERAFENCTRLISVSVPVSVTAIEDLAFCDCTSLAYIVLPDSVTSIGRMAFCNCTSLTSVVLPDSDLSISANPFCGCENLSDLILPEGGKFSLVGVNLLCTADGKKVIGAFGEYYRSARVIFDQIAVAEGNDPVSGSCGLRFRYFLAIHQYNAKHDCQNTETGRSYNFTGSFFIMFVLCRNIKHVQNISVSVFSSADLFVLQYIIITIDR